MTDDNDEMENSIEDLGFSLNMKTWQSYHENIISRLNQNLTIPNLKDFVNFGILEQYGVHLLPAGLGDKVSLIRLGWSVILVILDKSATCRLYTWFFFTALFIHSSHFEVTAK